MADGLWVNLRSSILQRLPLGTGRATPSGRLLNHFALFVTLPGVICVIVAVWLCGHILGERRAVERRQTIEAIADQTSVSVDALLEAGDLTAARRVVAELGRTPGVLGCTLTLSDGRVIADSAIRNIDMPTLPDAWHGPIQLPVPNAADAQAPFVIRSIDLPERGRLFLKLTLTASDGQLTVTELTAFGLLAVVGLLLALVAFRRARAQIAGVTTLSDAVCALADRTDQPLDQLRLGETVCTEANAWNRVLDRLHQLEQTTQAATMRSLLNGTAGPAAADDDADAGGRAALDSVVDLLPTGVLLLDSAGRIRNANGAGAALLSSDRSAIMGVDVRTLLSDAAFAEAIASTLARSHGGERRTLEIDRREQQGGVLRVSIRPLRREDQGGGLLTIEDVTQQRIADSSRNQFVAQATHELRAPLTNMRLCLETALDDDAGDIEALSRHLNVLNDETRRLERLVSEMLSVAEIEAGSLTLKQDDVKLDRLFEELKANNLGTAKEKGLTLTFDLPPKLPQLHGDREKIAAALHNLLNNAIKYTPSGGKVSVVARQDGARFVIDVADTGFGIAPADQARLFERFYRAKDPRVEKITGTGLGLALSRDVARLHGGDLTFKSELNQGTTFTFQLPAVLQPA